MNKKILSIPDARIEARRRMSKIMFDYIDGAAGSEYSHDQNCIQLDGIRLLPRVLVNTENRNLSKNLFGKLWSLLLTVDVPIVAPRLREQCNEFQVPFKMGLKQFVDFAIHPQWSMTTLLNGVPEVANNAAESSNAKFVRNESRGKVDWQFPARLRKRWQDILIVKGVLSADDALQIRDAGVDGIYVSNHGGRQLDSAPTTMQMLPLIRQAVGPEFPILFDSGVRNGEAVIKALAQLGRPDTNNINSDVII